ncbi:MULTISPECIES: O-antigen ligase family protein [Caproicibacterium]|uniref:O-antigen ligase family protein n=1 Tax=Caproicibacterium argilliputei TaxID=3030016 RepID=A0AA97H0Y9_9FIRM|nr:O-antigen ligase family protein [Caproicibacterium argilliputei]WOC31065.1 O-antigen ligase family protein [Caproicibacterium argilliputei]
MVGVVRGTTAVFIIFPETKVIPARYVGMKGVDLIITRVKAWCDNVKEVLFRIRRDSALADRYLAYAVAASLFLPGSVSGVAIVLAAFYVMVDYRRREIVFQAPFMKLLFGFFVLSFFVAAGYKNYMGMVMTLMLMAMLVYGMYLRCTVERRVFNRMLDIVCVMSIFAVLVAVVQKAAVFAVNPNYRPVSFFTNANYFGTMIEFTVMVVLYRAFTNRQFGPLYVAVLGINLIGMYLCSSMSALGAMSVGVVAFLLYKRQYKYSGFYVAALLLFFYANHFLPGLFPRVEAISSTTDQRLSIWHGALIGISQTPILGRGLRAYSMIYDSVGTYATYHCHNLYLDCLLNFGIVGCTVFVLFGLYYLRDVVRQIRVRSASNAALLFLAVLTVTLVHGFTDVTVSWTQTGMLFLIAFSATGLRSAQKEPTHAALLSKYGYFVQPELSVGYLLKE